MHVSHTDKYTLITQKHIVILCDHNNQTKTTLQLQLKYEDSSANKTYKYLLSLFNNNTTVCYIAPLCTTGTRQPASQRARQAASSKGSQRGSQGIPRGSNQPARQPRQPGQSPAPPRHPACQPAMTLHRCSGGGPYKPPSVYVQTGRFSSRQSGSGCLEFFYSLCRVFYRIV